MASAKKFIEIARHRVGREAVKLALGRLLRWQPITDPQDGFTIVLGVPWDLRHLLNVNLRFVQNADLAGLRDLFVVFDRCERPGSAELQRTIAEQFPDLPLTFLHYPQRPGRIVERVNVSTFYNSMNTVTALAQCQTQHAILHDFDLYPVVPEYFQRVVETMREKELRFSGLELTHFDGLTDDDAIIGTWCLGIDVAWLRSNWKPIHCFHRSARLGGREINLDPYSWIQTRTPARALAEGIDESSCCHVRNLCSTYLRFTTGRFFQPVWRLHYLWFLEELSGLEGRIAEVTRAMEDATSPTLELDGRTVDFSKTHVTCANVLRDELQRMDNALHGSPQKASTNYVGSFERFLTRFGDTEGHELSQPMAMKPAG